VKDRQPFLDRIDYPDRHLWSGVPVAGADPAAAVQLPVAASLMPHQLIDHPRGDATILQPGREGVPQVVGPRSCRCARSVLADACCNLGFRAMTKSALLTASQLYGWTVPAPPSTVTRWPSRRRVVASPVATTAGMPYSRATREAWAARVPPSVTTAAARANSVVQAGAVARATRTSPGWKRLKSPGPWTMRTRRWPRPAGATPAASPYSRLASPSACCSARRLIAASQMRRIAPLAGRISRQ
jgi:hypothetical protein